MRILVADDDRVVVHLVAALLRDQGHVVVPVFDAMQAVMFAKRPPPPDVVILDVNMPGGTGVEALRRLKASLHTAAIPVIVLSGTSDPEIPARTKALGAEAFLGKPVDPVTLFATLARVAPGA